MNKGMLTVGIILLSLFGLVLINIISNYSTGSEMDYYLVKETTEAAMKDSLDTAFSRKFHLLRMDKEKFAESFVRRFADSVDNTRGYTISFYNIVEIPPKVTVKVDSHTSANDINGDQLRFSTTYNAILESMYDKDSFTDNFYKDYDRVLNQSERGE